MNNATYNFKVPSNLGAENPDARRKVILLRENLVNSVQQGTEISVTAGYYLTLDTDSYNRLSHVTSSGLVQMTDTNDDLHTLSFTKGKATQTRLIMSVPPTGKQFSKSKSMTSLNAGYTTTVAVEDATGIKTEETITIGGESVTVSDVNLQSNTLTIKRSAFDTKALGQTVEYSASTSTSNNIFTISTLDGAEKVTVGVELCADDLTACKRGKYTFMENDSLALRFLDSDGHDYMTMNSISETIDLKTNLSVDAATSVESRNARSAKVQSVSATTELGAWLPDGNAGKLKNAVLDNTVTVKDGLFPALEGVGTISEAAAANATTLKFKSSSPFPDYAAMSSFGTTHYAVIDSPDNGTELVRFNAGNPVTPNPKLMSDGSYQLTGVTRNPDVVGNDKDNYMINMDSGVSVPWNDDDLPTLTARKDLSQPSANTRVAIVQLTSTSTTTVTMTTLAADAAKRAVNDILTVSGCNDADFNTTYKVTAVNDTNHTATLKIEGTGTVTNTRTVANLGSHATQNFASIGGGFVNETQKAGTGMVVPKGSTIRYARWYSHIDLVWEAPNKTRFANDIDNNDNAVSQLIVGNADQPDAHCQGPVGTYQSYNVQANRLEKVLRVAGQSALQAGSTITQLSNVKLTLKGTAPQASIGGAAGTQDSAITFGRHKLLKTDSAAQGPIIHVAMESTASANFATETARIISYGGATTDTLRVLRTGTGTFPAHSTTIPASSTEGVYTVYHTTKNELNANAITSAWSGSVTVSTEGGHTESLTGDAQDGKLSNVRRARSSNGFYNAIKANAVVSSSDVSTRNLLTFDPTPAASRDSTSLYENEAESMRLGCDLAVGASGSRASSLTFESPAVQSLSMGLGASGTSGVLATSDVTNASATDETLGCENGLWTTENAHGLKIGMAVTLHLTNAQEQTAWAAAGGGITNESGAGNSTILYVHHTGFAAQTFRLATSPSATAPLTITAVNAADGNNVYKVNSAFTAQGTSGLGNGISSLKRVSGVTGALAFMNEATLFTTAAAHGLADGDEVFLHNTTEIAWTSATDKMTVSGLGMPSTGKSGPYYVTTGDPQSTGSFDTKPTTFTLSDTRGGLPIRGGYAVVKLADPIASGARGLDEFAAPTFGGTVAAMKVQDNVLDANGDTVIAANTALEPGQGNNANKLQLAADTSGAVVKDTVITFYRPTTTLQVFRKSLTLKLPQTLPTADQMLKSSIDGQLAWTDSSSLPTGGSNGQVLKVVSGNPAWADAGSSSGTGTTVIQSVPTNIKAGTLSNSPVISNNNYNGDANLICTAELTLPANKHLLGVGYMFPMQTKLVTEAEDQKEISRKQPKVQGWHSTRRHGDRTRF